MKIPPPPPHPPPVFFLNSRGSNAAASFVLKLYKNFVTLFQARPCLLMLRVKLHRTSSGDTHRPSPIPGGRYSMSPRIRFARCARSPLAHQNLSNPDLGVHLQHTHSVAGTIWNKGCQRASTPCSRVRQQRGSSRLGADDTKHLPGTKNIL